MKIKYKRIIVIIFGYIMVKIRISYNVCFIKGYICYMCNSCLG